jgi:hypothetical protein
MTTRLKKELRAWYSPPQSFWMANILRLIDVQQVVGNHENIGTLQTCGTKDKST